MYRRLIQFGAMAAALSVGACQHGHEHASAAHADGHVHHDDKLVRAGEAPAVGNPFHPVFLLVSNSENATGATIYEFQLPPKSPGSPPHTHSLEDEFFYVISGELSVMSGEEILTLAQGDFAALNRGNAHMFWNASEGETRLLMMTTGASFESFMSGSGPAIAAASPQSAEEAGAVIGKLAAEHGMQISMEKMPPEAAPFYLK